MGADAYTRAANGDGTHSKAEEIPRLAFWSDFDRRLKDIQIATATLAVKDGQKAQEVDNDDEENGPGQ